MIRFAGLRIAAVLLVGSCVSVASASAQVHEPAPAVELSVLRAALASPALPAPATEQLPSPVRPSSPGRPAALVPLYVSFGALQVLDSHSTSRALDRGGVEANPVMKGFAGNQAAMLAVKAAGTVGVVYVTEKMWKKNRTAAVLFMVATNSAMAWVVQRNYQVR